MNRAGKIRPGSRNPIDSKPNPTNTQKNENMVYLNPT